MCFCVISIYISEIHADTFHNANAAQMCSQTHTQAGRAKYKVRLCSDSANGHLLDWTWAADGAGHLSGRYEHLVCLCVAWHRSVAPGVEAERQTEEKGCMESGAGEESKTKIDASVLSSLPELIHSAARPFSASKDRKTEWGTMLRRWTLWETALCCLLYLRLTGRWRGQRGKVWVREEHVLVTVGSDASSPPSKCWIITPHPRRRSQRLGAGPPHHFWIIDVWHCRIHLLWTFRGRTELMITEFQQHVLLYMLLADRLRVKPPL